MIHIESGALLSRRNLFKRLLHEVDLPGSTTCSRAWRGTRPLPLPRDPWLNVWIPTTNSTGIQDAALFHELTTGAW
jgi:hypothetical protein